MSEYSGQVESGWNLNASFERIQFSTDAKLDLAEIIDNFNKGGQYLKDAKNASRLDLRCCLDPEMDTTKLSDLLPPEADIALRQFSSEERRLTLGLNKGNRIAEKECITNAKKSVIQRVNKALNNIGDNFETFALQELENIKKEYHLVSSDFNTPELLKLWGHNFEWTPESISDFLENSLESNPIYGLRDRNGRLIAATLISDGESTEWSVLEEFQGHGLITPLLIYAHGNQINQHGKDIQIYSHLRYNRSISPGIQSGMNIATDENQFLLTNHVRVEGEYTHFSEAALNTKLFSQKLVKACKS